MQFWIIFVPVLEQWKTVLEQSITRGTRPGVLSITWFRIWNSYEIRISNIQKMITSFTRWLIWFGHILIHFELTTGTTSRLKRDMLEKISLIHFKIIQLFYYMNKNRKFWLCIKIGFVYSRNGSKLFSSIYKRGSKFPKVNSQDSNRHLTVTIQKGNFPPMSEILRLNYRRPVTVTGSIWLQDSSLWVFRPRPISNHHKVFFKK